MFYTHIRTAEESAFCKRACSISCRRVTGSTAEGLDFSNARELYRSPTITVYNTCVLYIPQSCSRVVDIIYIHIIEGG